MYGLTDIQRSMDDSASAGLAQASNLEKQRKMLGDQLRSADKQQMTSNIGTGAGLGFMAGGPVGAAIGAGVGYLMYKFL